MTHPRTLELITHLSAYQNDLEAISWSTPSLGTVYNTMEYAFEGTSNYLARFCDPGPKQALILGMNPGPWGMAQTGVPFGDIVFVRDWMGIQAHIAQPHNALPERPILGLDSSRREVSGQRLFGMLADSFKTPDMCFSQCFVWNYCPLLFLTQESARNLTPDKLRKADREACIAVCDRMLIALATHLKPRLMIGVGVFAHERALAALEHMNCIHVSITHPSPANPKANGDWAGRTRNLLRDHGWDL